MPKRLPFEYEHLGERQLKGFDEHIRVFSVSKRPGSTLTEYETAPPARIDDEDVPLSEAATSTTLNKA